MKFVILHGTSSSSQGNWFPWIKGKLEALGHEVWVPDLPDADHPNIARYNQFILSHNFDFNGSFVIGHSSGSVALLGLLEVLPKETEINTAMLVGAFTKRLSQSPSWSMLQDLFEQPFDYEAIKTKATKFVFVHSDDDPICPIEEAKELCQQLGGEFITMTGKGHMIKRLDPFMDKFPELLEVIKARTT